MGVRCRIGAILLLVGLPGLAMGQSIDPYNKNKGMKGKGAETEKESGEWVTVKTKFVPAKELPFISQGMKTQAIAGSVNLPTKPGITVLGATAYKLQMDSVGDGKADITAKGKGAHQAVVLTYPDGKRARYAISITHSGAKWKFRVGGYRIASYKGSRISLVDMNSDGYYDGRTDGMVVGRDSYVAYLSSVVSIKGKLFECKVNRSGSELKLRPYTGDSGKIDLLKGYKGEARLGAAIITNGTTSFNAAQRGLTVPAGTYAIKWGHVRRGAKTAFFRGGGTFTVEAGKVAVHKLGYPYKVDFTVSRKGENVTVDPNRVTIAGQGGEAYYDFKPSAFTPKVKIRHQKSLKTLNSGTMTLC